MVNQIAYPGKYATTLPSVSLSSEMQTLLGKTTLAAGEKPVTNVDLLNIGYPTITQPFNQNDGTIATTRFVKLRNVVNITTFSDIAITVGASSKAIVNLRHDGFAEIFADLTISAGTNLSGDSSSGLFTLATGLPVSAGGNNFWITARTIFSQSVFTVFGNASAQTSGYVSSAGNLIILANTINRTAAFRLLVQGVYSLRGF